MRTSQKRFPAQNPARWHPYVSSESTKCVYWYTFSAYSAAHAMVTWNTLHIGHVVEQLRAEGHTSDDTTLGLTTPLLRKHINPLGNIISIWSVIAKPQIRRRAKRLKPLTEVFGWMWPIRA